MPGGRAATVVAYCAEAERGGQTSFTNADIMVKGKAGACSFVPMLSPSSLSGACPSIHRALN